MKNNALLIIDIQNIYFTDGPYLLYKPVETAKIAQKVIEIFRKEKMPVIHVKHLFKTDAYEESNIFLNDIHKLVYPIENEKIIEKKYPNSFLKTDLLEYLNELEIKNLVIIGMMSHMCIDTTVRACQNYGFNVTVISDACTTKELQWNGEKIHPVIVNNSYMAGLNGMFANVISIKDFEKNIDDIGK